MKILGNLLILVSLIALIWFGIKGVAYLGSKATPAATALEEGGTKAGEFIADAGKTVTEKGAKAVDAIKGGVKSIREETVPTAETKEELFTEDEEINEKAPYEHDNSDAGNIEKGNIEKSTEEDTPPAATDKDVKETAVSNLAITEAKAKMALAQKRDEVADIATEKGETIKKEVENKVKKEINEKKPSDYDKNSSIKKSAVITKPYLVIAGAFSTPAAAKVEVARLKNLGCINASTFQFPNKESVAVAAGRYNGRTGAQMMVAKLNDLNIESYIYEQKK